VYAHKSENFSNKTESGEKEGNKLSAYSKFIPIVFDVRIF